MNWVEKDWYIDGSEGFVDKFLNIETGQYLIKRIAYLISQRPGNNNTQDENWFEAEQKAKYGLLRQLARKAGKL